MAMAAPTSAKKSSASFGHIDNGSLHGLVFGPDGWLYMTMGSPDGFRIERPGREPLTGTSGALFRCRPDGSRPEVLWRGFVNLVEVDFSPTGVVIGTNNWHQQPVAGIARLAVAPRARRDLSVSPGRRHAAASRDRRTATGSRDCIPPWP